MTKENNLVVIPNEIIADKIYFIRGYKVMIDNDLAKYIPDRDQSIETSSQKKYKTLSL